MSNYNKLINGENNVVQMTYVQDVLRKNVGKRAKLYMNFDKAEWGSKVFEGIISEVGRDHVILDEPEKKLKHVLLTLFLNYIELDEE